MREFTLKDQPVRNCVSCDRFFVSGRWSKSLEALIGSMVSEPVREVSVHPADAFSGRAPKRVRFEFSINADGEEHHATIELPVENMQCPECVKRRSHYFEGYLQVRGGSEEDYAIARSLLEKHRGYIKKEVRVKDGIDCTVSSNRAIIATLKDLSSRYIGTASTSATLHTRDHQTGKEKHRVTGLFRFSKVRRGDVLVSDGTLFVLEKSKGSLCELRSLHDGRTTISLDLTVLETLPRVDPFDSTVIITHPSLMILSESYTDVDAVNRSGRTLAAGENIRAVGYNGFYAVLE